MVNSVLLELTYNCNHKCMFCYCPWLSFPALIGRELDTAEWIKILDKLSAMGIGHITLSGGEPLLKKDFLRILTHAAALPFKSLTVFSNGLLVDENMLETFRQCKVQWATSLPGVFAFQKLTGSEDTVQELLGKMRQAALKKIPVAVSITAVRKNLWEMPLTMLIARFYGAASLQLGACMPEGRALEHPEFYLSDKQYKKLHSTATLFDRILKIPVRFIYEQRCACYNEDGTPSGTAPESCNAGKDYIVISPDGSVRKCMHAPEKMCMFEEFSAKEGF